MTTIPITLNHTRTASSILLLLTVSVSVTVAGPARLDIHSVDFYNFIYYSGSWSGYITLRKGRYSKKDPTGMNLFTRSRLIRLEYADLKGDGQEEAIITIRTRLNGSMPVAVDYYVFECRDGKPHQLLHRWQEGPEAICLGERSITVAAAWRAIGDPHCCPTYTETITYCWRATKFRVASRRLQRNYPFQNPRPLKCK